MKTKSRYLLFIYFALIFVLFGCEIFSPKPLQLEDMVPRDKELVFPSSGKSCCLGTFEGRMEKGDFFFILTAPELKTIMADSLKHSQLFTTVYKTEQKNVDYTLTAKILGEPLYNLGRNTLYVRYQIKRNDTGETVFNQRIQSVFTSSISDGTSRPQKGGEGVARENVKKFLEEISKIQL